MEILNEILFRPLFNLLIFLYNIIPGHDMGVAIIILTVLIRLILWAPSAKALRSQRELQLHQPEIEKLKTKYKDAQAQSRALMDYYKQHKISPFSSCLPTLIQFPILIALYQVFRYSLDTSHLDALYPFIHRPEIINPTFLGFLNLSQPEHYVLPILTGGLQFIQTKILMLKTPKSSASPTQQIISNQMTYIFPVMTAIIAFSLPAALPLYWIVTTLMAILQQWLIMRKPIEQKVKISIKNKESL